MGVARRARFEPLEDRLLLAFDPTGMEQEMLEYVNEFRMDPQGALDVLFTSITPLVSPNASVNTAINYFNDPTSAEIQTDWALLTPTHPLAWNEALYNTSNAHSQLMIQYDQQTHQLPGEPDLGDRITAEGYNWSYVGENIFAYTESVFHGHSAFAIDWAVPDRGHRVNLMDSEFKEIGIAIIPDSNPAAQLGPLVLTQDFAIQYGVTDSYLLGVVFDDINDNGRYDGTEGYGNVQIEADGPAGTFTTSTMTAGGYQLIVPPGTYTVTASGGGLSYPIVATNVVMGSENIKVDLQPGENVAPTADAGGPYAGYVRDNVTLDGSRSSDTPPGTIVSYEWDLDNDGSFDVTGVTATFNSTTAGNFTVGLQVTDNEGATDVATAEVVVNNGTSTIGLYDSNAVFHVKNDFAPGGVPDDWMVWGWGSTSGYYPFAGDWDGDGFDTIGLYDPNALFSVKNDFAPGGGPDDWLVWGWGSTSGYYPLAGDWDGDGIDTIGLYSGTGDFSLKNDFTAGAADVSFQWGNGTAQEWLPVAGDWDGDGIDTVGLYAPNGVFLFKNDLTEESPVTWLVWGLGADDGYLPIAGDWNGDGVDTIGLYDRNAVFSVKNDFISGGAPDDWLVWGWGSGQDWLPIAGNWDGPGGSPLLAAGDPVTSAAAPLTQADLQPIVAEAIADWAGVGLTTERLEALLAVDFFVTDLPGAQLGLATPDAIYLDIDAGGHGWFIDPTPHGNEEFLAADSGELRALDPQAVDRMDLLTVVSHELGHVLGLEDIDPSSGSLMDGTLESGLRRECGVAEIDALFAQL